MQRGVKLTTLCYRSSQSHTVEKGTGMSIVEFTFFNQYARAPWEPGILTKMTVQFTDRDGRMERLDSEIRATDAKVAEAETKILETFGIRHRFWIYYRNWHRRKMSRLQQRARKITDLILAENTPSANLRSQYNGSSAPWREVDEVRAERIRKDLRNCSRFFFDVRHTVNLFPDPA